MALENVTTICKNLRKYPDLLTYLNRITETCETSEKSVHKRFSYPSSIFSKCLCNYYGVFIDYFSRRYVAEKLNIPFKDGRAKTYHDTLVNHYEKLEGKIEIIVDEKEVDSYEENEEIDLIDHERVGDGKVRLVYFENGGIPGWPSRYILEKKWVIPGFLESYEKVIDTKTYKTTDIVNDIMNISNAHFYWFREKILTEPLEYDSEHLECVMKYLDTLITGKSDIVLNPGFGGKYYKGDGDMIIDDIIIDIKTSKYEKNSISDFHQLILYSYGAFDRLKKNIRKFKIYNALLGKESEILLNGINYDEFEQALKCCVPNLKRKNENDSDMLQETICPESKNGPESENCSESEN